MKAHPNRANSPKSNGSAEKVCSSKGLSIQNLRVNPNELTVCATMLVNGIMIKTIFLSRLNNQMPKIHGMINPKIMLIVK